MMKHVHLEFISQNAGKLFKLGFGLSKRAAIINSPRSCFWLVVE